MTDAILPILIAVKDWVAWLLSSNFFVALAGALAGAFAGAIAADRIATKKEKRVKLDNAVRDTNLAITLSGMIGNTALTMKAQHVLALHEDFVHEDIRFEEVNRRHRAGEIVGPREFVLEADLAELPELPAPVEALAGLVFEKLRLDGRALGVMLALQHAVNDLNLTIRRRNLLCNEFRDITEAERVVKYLGLPVQGGRDETYPQTVFHIYQLTNNVAFFAAKLAADLQLHGARVGERYAKAFRTVAPHINAINFDTPRARELMPPEVAYTDFLSMFQVVERPKPVGRFKRWGCAIIGWGKKQFNYVAALFGR